MILVFRRPINGIYNYFCNTLIGVWTQQHDFLIYHFTQIHDFELNLSFLNPYITMLYMKVCWEKFARYFEVELKEVKLREGYYVMDPEKAVEMVDENTICVAAILGSTLNGEFEDVKRVNDLLVKKNKETGYSSILRLIVN